MKKVVTFALFLILFCTSIARSQTGTYFTTDHDISSSLVNAIYQDQRYYIWIATEDGLNKFDGVRFTIYKSRHNDSTTIRNNYVRSLFEDQKGRFWIGCINGLHQYNRATDNFTEIPLYNQGLRITPHITSIIESDRNEIWLATSGEGIIRIKDGETVRTGEDLSSRLSSLHLTSVLQDDQGVFWIGSENQGLNRYDPVTDRVTVFREPYGIGSNQISAVCQDHEGTLFVGTLNQGLYKLNRRTGKFERIPHRQVTLSVKTLLIDHQGRLLVGTDGQGMKMYNPEINMLEDYPMLSAPFDFSRMKVHAICQDRAGNIWTGLFQKGVYLDHANPNEFQYWGLKSFRQNVIGSSCIMSLLKDRNDNLWVGTDNDGIYKLDKQESPTHYMFSDHPQSVPSIVLSMVEDHQGNLWLGSYLHGLSLFDKQSGRCTYYHHSMDGTDANTAHNKIFCMVSDQQNRLWIGTNGAGVFVFDPVRRKYIRHYSQLGPDYILNDWINTIMCDREGTVWIGSYKGIFSLKPDGTPDHYIRLNSMLPGRIINSIYEDHKGDIWIGTTEGLAVLNRQDQTVETYTVADGLPSNVICSILEDDNHNLWLSTHFGISKFITADKTFFNYYATDGLQGNEFSLGAAYKDRNGYLYFGGISGVTAFDPQAITHRRAPLDIYLTGLYVLDKPVVSGQKSGKHTIFKGVVSDVDTIRLSHRDNMFALEFSTFDFGFSNRVFYQYKLDGLNPRWMATELGINRISFNGIGHGTYHLKVKALMYGYSSDEKEIVFLIAPPWYLTWWAKILYFLLFVLLSLGVSKYMADRIRHRNELVRRKQAEQVSESKLQFFINVSHEIRTPMTLVISPLEKLISENNDPGKQKVYLLMYRNARRILRLINQLMDVRKIDKGLMSVKFRETDIIGFIDDLMQTFEYLSQKRNIRFCFIHQDEQLKVWIDLNNFDKVLVNILSNAFKFTPEQGEIKVVLHTGTDESRKDPLRNYFEIIISDTGIGIEKDKVEQIFERFYQIENKQPESSFGTGIGLHLSRSLVELMHGVIFARNRTDCQGSEFVIRLPMGSSHLTDAEKELSGQPVTVLREHVLPGSDENITEGTVKPKTKYRLLIVDDEDEIRKYLRSELSATYHIFEAKNGKEALEFILREKPNLVISDVMMPVMDGIVLSRKMKSNININHIPIILLTAKASDEEKGQGFDTGADAYVSKPFNIGLLKKRIINILENRERLEQKASDSEENKALIKPVVLKSSDQVLYEKIIRIVNENISDPDLNVEFLANGVGMSRVHMHRKLKELTNQSARDFIKTIRLKQAGELLSSQKQSISDVAYALGFNNLSHFSTSFREFYGMSPKEYAEKKLRTG